MIIPDVSFAYSNPFFLEGKKMEYVVSNERFKNNFWVNITPIDSINKSRRINFNQIKNFMKSFFTELEVKHQNFNKISVSNLMSKFVEGSVALLSINPSKISVELTSSESIFLFANKGSQNIYLELFFDNNSGKFAEAVINIYENKTQRLATSGTMAKVISEMDMYFRETKTSYARYFESPTYSGVSGSTSSGYQLQTAY